MDHNLTNFDQNLSKWEEDSETDMSKFLVSEDNFTNLPLEDGDDNGDPQDLRDGSVYSTDALQGTNPPPNPSVLSSIKVRAKLLPAIAILSHPEDVNTKLISVAQESITDALAFATGKDRARCCFYMGVCIVAQQIRDENDHEARNWFNQTIDEGEGGMLEVSKAHEWLGRLFP
ncbi:hypothetical protein K470DRAFT_295821 [Piedraia hortae CBS 480.64]|uniref:Uncharacterized protein n=1 Tax=Piedraia hortae CBS 480.64 TaxID=1314780 RepID=A0A6A7BVD0_9PEZI|nr:hypothetical protein K470DRAFT_295821 [Piedraia hortae CBS 480.64]